MRTDPNSSPQKLVASAQRHGLKATAARSVAAVHWPAVTAEWHRAGRLFHLRWPESCSWFYRGRSRHFNRVVLGSRLGWMPGSPILNPMNANPTLQPAATRPVYTARFAPRPPALDDDWDSSAWAGGETLEVCHFRPESSAHRPRTFARLLHSPAGLSGIFRVADRFVRCMHTEYGSTVWKDSCVEFFAQPKPDRGYLNFEFNCGGAHLCSHIVNPERTPDGFKQFTRIPAALGRTVQVCSSLPRVVEPEHAEPVTWTLRFFIPFALFEHYVGPLGALAGQTWRGNFFKCAEEVSQPHWAAWSPVDAFNFHLPHCFGAINFGPAVV